MSGVDILQLWDEGGLRRRKRIVDDIIAIGKGMAVDDKSFADINEKGQLLFTRVVCAIKLKPSRDFLLSLIEAVNAFLRPECLLHREEYLFRFVEGSGLQALLLCLKQNAAIRAQSKIIAMLSMLLQRGGFKEIMCRAGTVADLFGHIKSPTPRLKYAVYEFLKLLATRNDKCTNDIRQHCLNYLCVSESIHELNLDKRPLRMEALKIITYIEKQTKQKRGDTDTDEDQLSKTFLTEDSSVMTSADSAPTEQTRLLFRLFCVEDYEFQFQRMFW